MRYIITILCLLFAANNASAKIASRDIEYTHNDMKLKGTIVYDDAGKAIKPAVLLLPEWWGDNDYIKSRAKQMAEKGYVAFVADMYGEGKSTEKADDAKAWSAPFYTDRNLMRARAAAALNVLQAQANVDKNNIAIIGFCFGGTVALELGRTGTDVKGVAAFHAGLQFPDTVQPNAVKAKILVMNGENDPMVPKADRQKFIDEMNKAGADLKFIENPGAVHAFTNPDADRLAKANNLGGAIAYNKEAETNSFKALDKFFNEIFAK